MKRRTEIAAVRCGGLWKYDESSALRRTLPPLDLLCSDMIGATGVLFVSEDAVD